MSLSDEFPDANVCVVGAGYVGLTLAVVMASVGFRVEAVESNEAVVRQLKNERPHFFEPGLEAKLQRVLRSGHLTVMNEIPANNRRTVYIITVGTPLDGDGKVRTST